MWRSVRNCPSDLHQMRCQVGKCEDNLNFLCGYQTFHVLACEAIIIGHCSEFQKWRALSEALWINKFGSRNSIKLL